MIPQRPSTCGRGRAAASSGCSGQRYPARRSPFNRRMARPIVADVDLAAIAANLASRAPIRARRAKCSPSSRPTRTATACCACCPRSTDADGLALIELDAALALRAAGYSRADPAARRILRRRASSNRFATHALAHRRARRRAGADARDGALRAPHRRVRQSQHRDESPGFAPARRSRKSARGSQHSQSVASIRLMMHFARADDDDGIAEPLARIRARVRGLALSALARQFRGRRPLRRDRRRRRAAGHHAVWRDAVRVRQRRGAGPRRRR